MPLSAECPTNPIPMPIPTIASPIPIAEPSAAAANDGVAKASIRKIAYRTIVGNRIVWNLRVVGWEYSPALPALVRGMLGETDEHRGQECKDERLQARDKQLEQAQGGHEGHTENRGEKPHHALNGV